MKNTLKKLINLKKVNVIGIIRHENKEVFYTCEIIKRKSKIEIGETKSFFDFNELNANCNKKHPVILVLDGKGILNKKIDLNSSTDLEWIKNIDENDFVFNKYTNQNNIEFISFCRKNRLQEEVEFFSKNNFQILQCFIGSSACQFLLSAINRNKFKANNNIVTIENGNIIEIEKDTENQEIETYTIGNNKITNFHIPLYGAAIAFFTDSNIGSGAIEGINTEDFYYKIAFEKGAKIVLVTFFLLLLTSYTTIQFLGKKNAQLNMQNIYSNQSFEEIKKLEKLKETKWNCIYQSGIAASNYNAYYSYQIAKSVPNEINLLLLEVNPIEKEIKTTEKALFSVNKINIKGATSKEDMLNSWIEELKKWNWCSKLKITSIKKDKNNDTFFDLQIQIQ